MRGHRWQAPTTWQPRAQCLECRSPESSLGTRWLPLPLLWWWRCHPPSELDMGANEGYHLQHISDREMPEDLALETNPSDHPRASTVFLSKSQINVREKWKSNHLNHISLGQFTKMLSSCSTIFLKDSTFSQPSLRTKIKCVTLAIYYHLKNRDANRSLDIFE